MKVKNFKEFVAALPEHYDEKEIRFQHLSSDYSQPYHIKGYYLDNTSEKKDIVVITDINVRPLD
jgi:hypothetical protein